MKNATTTVLKLIFGAIIISSLAACNQNLEPVVLDNGDAIVADDGSSQKIPGISPDGEAVESVTDQEALVKWTFPQSFPKACNTAANIVQNPKFMVSTGAGNIPPATIAPWAQAWGTPQLGLTMGHGNPKYVQMWGYKDGGEAIKQAVAFGSGAYDVYFSVKQFNTTTQPLPLRARLVASSGTAATPTPWNPTNNLAVIDIPASATSWTMYGPFTINPGGSATTITLAAANLTLQSQAQPSTVSWGQFDNVCIIPKAEPVKADISITKTLESPAVAGQPNFYLLNITNAGPGTGGAPVTVTDVLPAGVTLGAGFTPPSGWTCNTSSLPTITCTSLTPVPLGTTQIMIPVTINANQVGPIKNCASVFTPNDITPQNNESCVTSDVVPATPKPFNLGIKKELVNNPATGIQFYTLTVTNFGPGVSSTPVNIIDNLPVGVTLGGTVTTSPVSAGFGCTGTVSCSSSTPMAAGSSVVIMIPVVLNFNGGTDIVNCASVSAVGDTNPKDDRSCVTTVAPIRPFDLEVKKEFGNLPGTTFQAYTLTVTNLGAGSSGTPINITDVLPAGVILSGTVTSSSPNFNCTGMSTITCTSNTAMPAGSSVVITIPVTINSTGTDIVNCADVTAPNDINPQNDHSCVTTK